MSGISKSNSGCYFDPETRDAPDDDTVRAIRSGREILTDVCNRMRKGGFSAEEIKQSVANCLLGVVAEYTSTQEELDDWVARYMKNYPRFQQHQFDYYKLLQESTADKAH